ncbi:DUF423 domain-containing protein [Chitinophagaceae bacterium MMS25-I14]
MYKRALVSGSFLLALAVIFGAFAAHALKQILPADQLQVFETGVRYHFYHGFALLFSGIIYSAFPDKNIIRAASCFLVGIILFSGSLYTMALLSAKGISLGPIGIVTPIGGVFFIAGWLLLTLGIMKKN